MPEQDDDKLLISSPKQDRDNLNERLDGLESMVRDIHRALVGDKALGHRGLVIRVYDVEAEQRGHRKVITLWTGGLVTLNVFVVYLLDIFRSR